MRGLALLEGPEIHTAMTLGYSAVGMVECIYIIRNPDKLRRLVSPFRQDPRSGALSRSSD
ncbi:hypothetical protein [Labrenzia sp. 011]|uniref:hypothetical protein n=1 Tax=Labrenzia sp. 011 TaxID=2171494 RepID=UPI000D518E8A|nr:hypothetical protein [Labrenzia sp. 011]PVB60045.1 hypothetical protein DCO57_19140 [Labrenzia sp. 011]